MPSYALAKWAESRAQALDSLDVVHGKVTGGRPGRSYATTHYNLTMFVALAAEFQGFCRDLQEDGATALVESLPSEVGGLSPVFFGSLVRDRKLDRGNARHENLAADFQILGMALWPEMEAIYGAESVSEWKRLLVRVNDVRNAVAHSNEGRIYQLRREEPLTLKHWRRHRAMLNRVAVAMDQSVGAYLTQLTTQEPW